MVTVTARLAQHIQACSCNAYEVNELIRRGFSVVDCESVELGGAVYPTIRYDRDQRSNVSLPEKFVCLLYCDCSLSNHACTANTSRTNCGTRGVVRATRTIFPKERVWDNYGYFYHTEERQHRRGMLQSQYFFTCNCPACKDDWPSYHVS